MTNIGKYITEEGLVTDVMPKNKLVLGVIFDETDNEFIFLPFADIDCCKSYSLRGIMDIAESYNLQHGHRYLHWSVPSWSEWNLIIARLGKTDVMRRQQQGFKNRIEVWAEFDEKVVIENLTKYNLSPKFYYWSSSQGYDEEVYFMNLAGLIEPHPVWEDGEEYDYALRLVGHAAKNKNFLKGGWGEETK